MGEYTYTIAVTQIRSPQSAATVMFHDAEAEAMATVQGRGIGLALSGGAARGIAHAGVLEVLVDAGVPVRALAGTSAGSIVGALFAAGVSPADICRLALETRWSDLFSMRLPRAGMIPGDGLQRFLDRLVPAQTFAQLRLPFAAVATDLATGLRVDLTTGPLARAVLASCSLPILLEPVAEGGRLLVDGGLSSQLPVRAARAVLGTGGGAAPVVAVDVNVGGLEQPRLGSVVDVALHLAMLWSARIAREEQGEADLLVGVDARGIALHDLTQGPELLRRGRAAARAALPQLRALLERPLP
jgi:NTE family protein